MTTTLAFVCVQNAGRSQMATAFAERERDRRTLDYDIITGGTRPADAVHPEVIDAMQEVGIDLSDRTPRAITDEELARSTVVATMGCSTLTLPDGVESHDWALDDPDGKSPGDVAAIRDEVERRVVSLFDSLE